MRILFDTHLLVWGAQNSPRLPSEVSALMTDPSVKSFFSAASVWELAIKASRKRPGLQIDPVRLRGGLLATGYHELPVDSQHALHVLNLPPIHKDPFDRLLVAQAIVEGLPLLTVDPKVSAYGEPVRRV